jgi:hypothetical protein
LYGEFSTRKSGLLRSTPAGSVASFRLGRL